MWDRRNRRSALVVGHPLLAVALVAVSFAPRGARAEPPFPGDFGEFRTCFSSPEPFAPGSACDVFDFDGDSDLDLQDFADWQRLFSGAPLPMQGSLHLEPVPGLTSLSQAAPAATAVPIGTTVSFEYFWTDPGLPFRWVGAQEVGQTAESSQAQVQLDQPGWHVVVVEIDQGNGWSPAARCPMYVVDVPVQDIACFVDVSVAPLLVDENSSNTTRMGYVFSADSIAQLQEVGPGQFRTSVRRSLTFAVQTDPPGLEPLMEWSRDGTVLGLGDTLAGQVLFSPGNYTFDVGPAVQPEQVQIDTYEVTITSHVSGVDFVPDGAPVTFTAVTDPPGYEDDITWLSATLYGTAAPVLGSGPTFTVQFDDTVGPNVYQWLGIRADNAVFDQEPQPLIDYWTTCTGIGTGQRTTENQSYHDVTIPAGFFGPGCDPFVGTIYLGGVPLDPDTTGSADTMVRRSADPVTLADPVGAQGTVGIQIVALSLESTEPITVMCNGVPEYWEVAVDLSSTPAPAGTLTATKTHANGGVFESTLFVQPELTFTDVSTNGPALTLDTAAYGWPPLEFVTTSGSFVNEVNPDLGIMTTPGSEFVVGVEETVPGDPGSQSGTLTSEEALYAKHFVCPGEDGEEDGDRAIDLEIHKPKVIDPAEPAIPDPVELIKGAQTFVNLDNDDQDWLFDTMDVFEDDNVAGEDEMTLLELKVKPATLEGVVTLSATAGGGSIKVWDSANKGTEVPLPATFNVPADFPLIEGDWRVKKLWVEGRTAHTAQQETKLKMELNKPAVNNPDEVALTVIGIDKIEWVGKNNSRNDNNTLDAEPNWPGGVNPGSVRVFPGARVVGGNVEANPRDKVDVKVTLTVDPVRPVKIYFDSFDVDDPTSATAPIDGPGAAAGNEVTEEDNRGTTPDESGQFVKADGTSDEDASGRKEHEFPDKEETFLFRTTMHPGDNFRVVGNGDKDFLPDLENKDSTYAGNNNDKQRIVNKHVTGTAAQREVRLANNYASDKVLTVWRFLHVESDSMVAVPVPPNAGHNRIVTTLSGIRNGTTELTVPANLEDNSWDLDDPTVRNGRFDRGTVRIGTGGGLVTINNIVGNGDDFVRHTGAIALPFVVGKVPLVNATGNVTALAGNVFTLNVTGGALQAGHNGGTLTMAGEVMNITAVNVGASQVTVGAHAIDIDIRDDDDEEILPANVDFAGMATPYATAYILPLADGGTAAANNQQNVNFTANATGQQLDNNNMRQDTPAAAEQDRFWVAYMSSAFQYRDNSDDDPQTEGGTGGVSFAVTSNAAVATGGNACWVFYETTRDRMNNDVPPAAAGLNARDAAHETGHQLGLGHINDTLMNPSLQQVPANTGFAEIHLHLLRSRVRSPGQ